MASQAAQTCQSTSNKMQHQAIHQGVYLPKRSCFISSRKGRPACSSSRPSVTTPAVSTTVQPVDSILTNFLTSKKVNLDKLVITTDLQTGEPIIKASKDASAGEALLSIPDSLWLSPDAVQKSKIGPLVKGLEPWLQVALFILSEKATGSSAWQGYLDSLPSAQSSQSPLLWSNEQLALLQGTQLLQNVLGYRQYFQAKYQELQQGLFSQNPAAFPPSVFSWENFLWAAVSVRARTHAPLEGPKIALVPGADLVSHRRRSNCKWAAKQAGLFGGGQQVVLEATKAVRKGETLAMDFAPEKLESAVLLDYGVTDDSQPKMGYNLTLSIPSDDTFLDDKLDIAESRELGQSQDFVLSLEELPSSDMLAFLRLMHLSGADAFLLEAIFRNEIWDHLSLPLSEGNEKALCQAMVNGAKQALASHPTTIDQDIELLRSGKLQKGSREHMAVTIRLGEKEALDSALRFFEERMQPVNLKQLEYYGDRRLKRLGLLDEEGRSTYDDFFKDGIA